MDRVLYQQCACSCALPSYVSLKNKIVSVALTSSTFFTV
jgi:hypothetical protein